MLIPAVRLLTSAPVSTWPPPVPRARFPVPKHCHTSSQLSTAFYLTWARPRSAPPAPIATTEVPPSYLKPLDRALSKLKAKTAKARATLNATVGGGSSGSIPAAGSAVLKAAHGLQRQSRLLTSKVKHTPIIILAIQRGMDSRHVPIDI